MHGVDYDPHYVAKCKELISSAPRSVQSRVSVECISFYEYPVSTLYDAVYFSGSLMIMPDPIQALRHASTLLNSSNGYVYLTQTCQTRRSRFAEFIKPLLKFFTSIDFGRVTYEAELLKCIDEAGLDIVSNEAIAGSKLDSLRSFRLIVLQPRSSSSAASSLDEEVEPKSLPRTPKRQSSRRTPGSAVRRSARLSNRAKRMTNAE